TTPDGNIIASGREQVSFAGNSNTDVYTIGLAGDDQEQAIIMAWLECGGQKVSTNLAHFSRPKNLILREPEYSMEIRGEDDPGDCFTIRITVKKPALYVFTDLRNVDANWSDRYFHIMPGRPVDLVVRPPKPMTMESVREQLVIKSLYDTFEHPAR
ncbi:MAG: hypothetical protein JJU11_03355, partial [Candidatus Sumerlaeia bacterium]|nr:hypothetical protein [Candidatus Sumerlaeia bacterium]